MSDAPTGPPGPDRPRKIAARDDETVAPAADADDLPPAEGADVDGESSTDAGSGSLKAAAAAAPDRDDASQGRGAEEGDSARSAVADAAAADSSGSSDAAGGAGPAEHDADDGGFTAFVEHVQLVTGSVTVIPDRSRPTAFSSQDRTTQRARPPGPAAPVAPGRSLRGTGARPRVRRRPELLGLVVVLVLALVCAGVIWAVTVKSRNDAAAAAREAAAYTPPPLDTAGPSASSAVVAVIGDESALRSVVGVDADGRWPRQLSQVAGVRVTVLASAGAGYVAAGAGGDDFADLAAKVPTAAAAVVFVGGAADIDATSLALAQSATQAVAAASRRAPDATVLVVGPLFEPDGAADSELRFVRNTLRSAAGVASVQFVDPIQSGWLDSVDSASALTAADGRIISSRISTALGSSIG